MKTIMEKRKDIIRFCNHFFRLGCEKCPLEDNCVMLAESPDQQIERIYSKLESDFKVDFNLLKKKKYRLYIRIYDITKNDYILIEREVETTDIYHEIGQIYCKTLADIKRIDYWEIKDE